jgi:hypothetical protein
LCAIISDIFSPTRSAVHFDAAPGEQLSRYLTRDNEYSTSKRIVRFPAFLPPKTRRHSVYWTSGLHEEEIWNIGLLHVAPKRGPIDGRADLNSLIPYREGLAVELTAVPHPRHADIFGWSEDRKKTRLRAQKLADEAMLVIRSEIL